MKIYLAAAIDKFQSDVDWFQKMGEMLAPHVCFNPKGAYKGITEDSSIEDKRYVIDMNMAALRNCDLMVARVEKVHSVGLPMELYYASSLEKPIPVITWYPYADVPGIYLEQFGGTLCRDEKEVVQALENVCCTIGKNPHRPFRSFI